MENQNKYGEGPLKGLKVLDLTRILSGPFACTWLGQMGARVIKIENPSDPDITRSYEPFKNGVSAYFPTFNHNKECITLNLKAEKGKDLFKRLILTADVVIENFRPGVMEKLGLGYEALADINPGIVYASLSGFGTYGPYSQLPGYDVSAQAISGIMHLTGPEDGPPFRVGSSIGDTVSGITVLVAILAALYNREQTGRGQMVETSLVDSLISLSTSDYIRYFAGGDPPRRVGNIYKWWTPYGTYKAKDNYYIIGGANDHFFGLLCQAMDMPELARDPRFVHNKERVDHRQELDDIINAWAADKTADEICRRLRQYGVPTGQVNSIEEISRDEHIAEARDMFPVLHQETVGDIRVTNIPVRFHRSGLAPLKSAHGLGADNQEILGELGLSEEEIASLRRENII